MKKKKKIKERGSVLLAREVDFSETPLENLCRNVPRTLIEELMASSAIESDTVARRGLFAQVFQREDPTIETWGMCEDRAAYLKCIPIVLGASTSVPEFT